MHKKRTRLWNVQSSTRTLKCPAAFFREACQPSSGLSTAQQKVKGCEGLELLFCTKCKIRAFKTNRRLSGFKTRL